MELITREPLIFHVGQDDVVEFEQAILADKRVKPARMNRLVTSSAFYAADILHRVGRRTGHQLKPFPGRNEAWGKDRDLFVVLMGLDVPKCVPYFLMSGRKSVYLFDAWPSQHQKIRQFVTEWAVDHVFVSASQAAEQLHGTTPSCQFHWIPEGIDPSRYRHLPHRNRDIDLLQLGRKYDQYHEQIVNDLERTGLVYLYEKRPREIIFPSRHAFIDGLARSKISICVPSSITHPERSGDIETMTLRYLQSMAAKCLVLGHAPAEMVRLFGYNPVIEIDTDDPVGQVQSVLHNFDDHIPMIERNYQTLTAKHTWYNRWSDIAEILLQ